MKPYYERDGITIYHGDCRDVMEDLPESTFDMVMTDPPYPRQYDFVWGYVANHVPRVMKNKTFLATFCGHYQIPLVISTISQYLEFFWAAATMNNNCPIMHGFSVKVNWKPVFVFRKGGAKPRRVWMDCFNVANNVGFWKEAKDAHVWGQAENLLWEPIDALSPENGTILDPFAGGGSTLKAAEHLGRKCVGIEIDERNCEIMANRMSQDRFVFTRKTRKSITASLSDSLYDKGTD